MALRVVKENIEQLNEMFPNKESQIEFLLFLWSSQSNYCKQLISSVPPEIRKYFYGVSVDNSGIRQSIMNSEIKITQVPSVILLSKSGKITTYEGLDRCSEIFQFINEVYSTFMKKKMSSANNATPINQILSSEEVEEEEEPEINHKKIRNARIPQTAGPPPQFRDIQKRPEIPDLKTVNPIHKKKGKKVKKVDMSNIDGSVINDDIEDMLNTDVNIDPEIRSIHHKGAQKGIKEDSKERMKRAIEEMQKVREEEVSKHEMVMKGVNPNSIEEDVEDEEDEDEETDE